MEDIFQFGHKTTHEEMTDYSLHCHPAYELYVLLEGNVEYLVEGVRYTLQPGSLLLLRPGCFHGYRVRDEEVYERFTLHFFKDALPPDVQQELLCVFHQREVYLPEAKEVVQLLRRFEQAGCFEEAVRNSIRTGLLIAMLTCLRLSGNAGEISAGDASNPLGSQVAEYISTHLQEDISIETLCRIFYISPRHLLRIFRESTGTSVGEYMRRKRLILAEELRASGFRAEEAASRAGYHNYSTYFRAKSRYISRKCSQS